MGVSRVAVAADSGEDGVPLRIEQAVGGGSAIRPAQLGRRHKLVGAILTFDADGTLEFFSGATSLNGPFDVAAKGGFVYDSHSPFFRCNPNEDLRMTVTGGTVSGVALVVTETV